MLVRGEDYLYVGLHSFPHSFDSQGLYSSTLGLMLDPDHTREEVANASHVQVLKKAYVGSGDPAEWHRGDERGSFWECEAYAPGWPSK